jgi:hypothetical protein
MGKILKIVGITGLGLFLTSFIIMVFGVVYKIPDSSLLVDIFNLCLTIGTSLLALCLFIFVIREFKNF